MKLHGIAEEIQRAFGGGKSPADNKFNDLDYVFQLINEFSAKAISLSYTGSKSLGANKNIGSKTWLEFPLTLNPSLQESGACFTVFACPDMIMIDSKRTGFSFVGDKNKMVQFSEVLNPSEFASLTNISNLEGIYYTMSQGLMKVAGRKGAVNARDINQALVIGRPVNPLELAVTYYNPLVDDYPIPDDLIPLMITIMKAELLQQEAATPQDTIANNNANK